MKPPIDEQDSKHPLALLILILFLIVGIPMMFGKARPQSVTVLLPNWLIVIWGGGLAIGSALALVGIFWKKRVDGLIIEQFGLAIVVNAAIFYAVCAFTYTGLAVAYPAGLAIVVATFFSWRWIKIQRILDSASRKAIINKIWKRLT